ncbi:MAG: bifunctional oligoribonuclease/PAP phosphatase NrnA [Erysipelotrichaceae bacterium]|nr:bifunctional oligoribonuclease/PAP phosphatase NrnA [Erysipelotrichaceae bacterium]
MFEKIFEKIKAYDIITIFRHIRPDGDAVGSQMAFKTWINDNFKDKKVYVLGDDLFDIYPYHDYLDDETIKKSLAISLDCSNRERIDDQRYKLAKEIIKIDHHDFVDDYGNINYVDKYAAATCEILTQIFKEYENSYNSLFTTECAEYLYSGLLTDTLSFKTTNVSAKTLECASYLVNKDINPSEINLRMFIKSFQIFKLANYIRSNVNFENGLAYAIFDNNAIKILGVDGATIRNQISELGNVKEFQIWVIITQEKEGHYRATLRSKKIHVNRIAEHYGGGGHLNAAGVDNLSNKDVKELITILKKSITDNKN